MDDEQTNPTTGSAGEPTAAADAGGASAKAFTQVDVDRIVGQRLAEDRKRREAPAKQPATGDGEGSERVTLKQLQQDLAETKMRSAFDKRAAKLGIDDETSDELFEVYRAKPPEDPSAWFDRKAKIFGLGTNPTTPPASTPASPAQPAAPAAAPNAPRAVDPINGGGLVDLWGMPADRLAQMSPTEVRKHFDAIKADAAQRSGAPPMPRGMPTRK